jgi:hypothetical protein
MPSVFEQRADSDDWAHGALASEMMMKKWYAENSQGQRIFLFFLSGFSIFVGDGCGRRVG